MSKPQEKSKRTFSSVFSNRVYGASKAAGFPKHVNGIMFYSSEANSLDPQNPEKAKHYSRARLGNAFVLTEDKMERIMKILAEGMDDESFIGSGVWIKNN
jgi:hypothetical protein